MTKFTAQSKDFKKALDRFKEVLRQPKSEIIRDSSIKRFELLFDLSWKTLKSYLEIKHGIVVNSPVTSFREAFRQGLIDYDERWIEMVKTRNETVHAYNEPVAEKAYALFPEYLAYFEKLALIFSG